MNPSRVVFRLRSAAVPALVGALLALSPSLAPASAPASGGRDAVVVKDGKGFRIQVDGRDFMVIGMNWDYFPIGTNYNFSLWKQPDDMIEAALAREMPLLKAMGVNVIRVYDGIPAKWVKHIYERYGIYTAVNHAMGRYGMNVDGVWIPENKVDYSDPRFRAAVKAEVLAMVDGLKDTPGVLMWMLGNENNYGLSWRSSEIENLPVGEQDAGRARYLYSLIGRDRPRHQGARPGPPRHHGQRRRAVHRPHRPGGQGARHLRDQRLPRQVGRGSLPGRPGRSSASR